MKESNLNHLYTFQQPCAQNFPLPYPLIRYIIKNPVVWKKIIQTCKYFYLKNCVFPCGSLKYSYRSKYIDGELIEFKNIFGKLWLFDTLKVDYDSRISNFTRRKKCYLKECISLLIPHIGKNELQNIDISHQKLTWKEYHFLTSSCFLKLLRLYLCTIKYSDGKTVTFDKLLERLSTVNNFYMFCSNNSLMFESNTVKNMVKNFLNFKNMRHFVLTGLPEAFDFSSIIDFLMENDRMEINLTYFAPLALSVKHRETLDRFIDKILTNPPKQIPYVRYPGFTGTRYTEYHKLRHNQTLSNSSA